MTRTPQQAPPAQPPKKGLGIRCKTCPDAIYNPDAIVLSQQTPGEKADALYRIGVARGWSFETVGGALDAYCKACTEKRLATELPKETPPFDPAAACAKCGEPKVTIRYCTGREANCAAGVNHEHLHRGCTRCGFGWVERCKNESAALKGEGKSDV